MSEREAKPKTVEIHPDLVIPDGGLGTSMPDWLQQRPEWAADSPPASKPVGPEMTPVLAPTSDASREIPPPDASPIHLEDILVVDDLPQWLQAIARRTASDAESDETLDEPAVNNEGATVTSEIVSATPQIAERDKVSVAESTHTVKPIVLRAERADPKPFWLTDAFLGGLIVAIILTLIYVILVASDVF